MAKRKLIIHPGIGKTATSAIQYQLHRLSGKQFSGTHYVYPSYGLDSEFAHHFLAEKYPGFNKEMGDHFVSKIINDAVLYEDVVYIISSEFLAHCSQGFITDLISKFRSAFSEIVVFYSIRNYVDLIYSSYLQGVKVNYGVENGEDIVSYSKRMGRGFDFPFLFKKWESADRVFYLDYDQNKKGFVRYFLENVGCKGVELAGLGDVKNISIIEDVVNIIFNFDAENPSEAERERFINNMLSFSYNYKSFSSRVMRERIDEICNEKWASDFSIIKQNYNSPDEFKYL